MSEPPDDEDAVGAGVVVFGLYWLTLGLVRGYELLGVPADVVIAPPFPSWLISYLYLLVGWLLVNGALWLACFVLLKRGRPVPRLGRVALGSSLALIAAHVWFTYTHDAAVHEGGAIPGLIDLLTLTREYIPGGATAAGLKGFRIGQGLGFACWLFATLGVSAGVLRPRDTGRAPRAS